MSSNNFIQKAFEITKENIILAQPLVIFMIVLSFTLAGLAMQANRAAYIVFAVSNVLLCTAFFAGWFYMVKQGIYLGKRIDNGEYKAPEDRAAASLALGKEFFPGVGEYFLPMTLTIAIYTAAYIALTFGALKLGMQILPHINIDLKELMAAANSTPVQMQKYVLGLGYEQLKAINIWMLYLGGILTLFTFFTMFLFPAVYDDNAEKRELFLLAPFKALWRNLRFIFKNFFGSLGIIVFLFFLNTVLSLLSVVFNLNIILAIVGLIISFYFMTYAIVLIFLYYEDRKN